MTPDIAKATMQFLQRAQMTGAEVPAYIRVMQALTEIAKNEPQPVSIPAAVKRGRKPKAPPVAPPASA